MEAKIQEAILAAMGGKDDLVARVIDQVFNQKVNAEGKVSNYSSDNKYTWIEVAVINQINTAVKDQMKIFLEESGGKIKQEIIRILSSKKGIEQFAASLLDQTTKISDRYYSTINVEFSNKKNS